MEGPQFPGPLVGAIRYAGEDSMKTSIFSILLVPYKTASGGYRQENSFRYLIATA